VVGDFSISTSDHFFFWGDALGTKHLVLNISLGETYNVIIMAPPTQKKLTLPKALIAQLGGEG